MEFKIKSQKDVKRAQAARRVIQSQIEDVQVRREAALNKFADIEQFLISQDDDIDMQIAEFEKRTRTRKPRAKGVKAAPQPIEDEEGVEA